MFLFTYVPQLAILFFTSGPLAAFSTALLVLSESSTLTTVLSKALLIEDSLIDTFDGTLLTKGICQRSIPHFLLHKTNHLAGHTELVAKERKVKSGGAGDAVARLGKLMGKPFAKFTPTAIIQYLMYLPLNFIPVVGTIAFVVLQGRRAGPAAQNRYFQLKGMSQTQREKHVEERKAAYTRYVLLTSQVC